MIFRSRNRKLTLLNPQVNASGRPVGGTLITPSGVRYWSTDGAVEEVRKVQSDVTPLNTWPARKDDWEEAA